MRVEKTAPENCNYCADGKFRFLCWEQPLVTPGRRRRGGTGQMLFAGSLSEQATVTVAGNSATVNHTTTNFTAYASVISGTNVIPITATDYNANSTTNIYQVVVTNNGVAETLTFDLNGNETSVVAATSTNSYCGC